MSIRVRPTSPETITNPEAECDSPIQECVGEAASEIPENDITLEQLQEIFPDAGDAELTQMRDAFNAYYDDYDLDTPLRRAHFFAQLREEVGTGVATRTENLNYSAERLPQVFSAYRERDENDTAIRDEQGRFAPNNLASLHGRSAQNNYTANQEEIANNAYANRMGNGDASTGDGWRYRGQGYIQLTGRNNYTAINDEIQERSPDSEIDIINNDGDIATVEGSMVSAMAYWTNNNLNDIADQGADAADVDAATAVINQNTDSYADRREHFAITRDVFNVGDPEIRQNEPEGE